MRRQHDSVAAHQYFEYAEGISFELDRFEVENSHSVNYIGKSSQLYTQIGAFLSTSMKFSDFPDHGSCNKVLNHGLIVVFGSSEGRGQPVELNITYRVDVEKDAGQNKFVKFIEFSNID
jgi:hypothetical protein